MSTYPDLPSLIEAFERCGELHRVQTSVSAELEITEITDRISKSDCAIESEHASVFDPKHAHLGGKALLFENVKDASFPLLINAYGSYHRCEMALGCLEGGFNELGDRIAQVLKPEPPTGIMAKMKKGLELAKIANWTPKEVGKGACQEIVLTDDQVNLDSLPILKCWPYDGDPRDCNIDFSPEQSGTAAGEGRFVTFAGIHTIAPEDAGKQDGQPRMSRNVGMYRLQKIDSQHLAMHWHMHHDGARHWRAWKEHNKAQGTPKAGMPVAIALGGPSVMPYAATAPLPPGISELLMAGFLQQKGVEMVRCKTVDLHVPADSEIIIEGYVSTECEGPGWSPENGKPLGEGAVFEGPFGDHTGFYSLPDRYPVVRVTAITHRKKAVYPATIVGLPPQEDYYLGKATERVFLPLLKTLVPDIIDYDLPMFGAFHNCAVVKIKKEYPLQARRIMHAIWGAGQMAWTKAIIVVDHDVNVHDHEEVLFHVCANCDPGRDLEIVNGPLDILDHAAPRLGAGHKIGFDATAKWTGEEVNGHPVRPFPSILRMDDIIKEKVSERWSEYGF